MAKDCYMPPYYRYAYRYWLTVLSLLAAMPSIVLADCNPWAAKLVSIEGTVELRDSEDAPWTQAFAESLLCPGAHVRVGEYGRAAVVLHDNTLLRLDARSTLSMPPGETPGSLLDLLQGTVHFISRVTRGLTVRTPFVNAGVEGTEFLVEVEADSTAVIVFEGKVRAVNAAGEVLLQSGERARATGNQAPVRDIPVKPRDAVQWALYYPPILSFTPEPIAPTDEQAWQARVAQSMQLYREGQLARAHAALVDISAEILDARLYTYRASLNLAMGQVTQAQHDIDYALTLTPANTDALALKAIIAIVQNERELGLALAQQAVTANPTATGAILALSYALQAGFRLEEARSTLERAVAITPTDALLWSRLAELHLMFRYVANARVAAERATALAPNLSHTQTVLGFSQLIGMDVSTARTTFTHAITLDQSAPLPHLGLGLSMIRAGELELGRRELELAAILNPSEALIRSYLGKAYYEERREDVAADQYAMAKQLDPLDPTPWFYAAILKQTQNQPIAALEDLQRAMALNDNRAVYRSRQLLDEDAAARSVGLARVYQDLGFEPLALNIGRQSVADDPSNYSAHRLLANSYTVLPRHEVARVSELLQSQLLQPLTISSIQPQLSKDRWTLLDTLGPPTAALNEFNPLFNRNQSRFQGSALVGSQGTRGGEVLLSGLEDRFSYGAGYSHFETDGFHDNNAQEEDIYSAFFQFAPLDDNSVQFEAARTQAETGDAYRFDPKRFDPQLHQSIDETRYRLGARYRISAGSVVLGSVIVSKVEDESRTQLGPVGLSVTENSMNTLAEIRNNRRTPYGSLDWGVGYAVADIDSSSVFGNFPPTDGQTTRKHANAYIYDIARQNDTLTWALGISGDRVMTDKPDVAQINPKIGVIWQATRETTLRAAAFRVLKRTLVSSQTIEPTEIAGFNQFFDDPADSDVWAYAFGLDRALTRDVFWGGEIYTRSLTVPYRRTIPSTGITTVQDTDWHDDSGHIYVFWLLDNRKTALTAEYFYEDLDLGGEFSAGRGFKQITTQRIPFGLVTVMDHSMTARFVSIYTTQDGDFSATTLSKNRGSDNFWIADAELTYRLPGRTGFFSLGIRNLFDRSFQYQNTDPSMPSVAPERSGFVRLSLAY